jgi:hypothetical protein
MSSSERASRRKDRLIQTRVRGVLESTLKEEARKRRLSVSHLIRNILEDSLQLVDNVVGEVDNIVNDSIGLANQVRRDAQKIASTARGRRGAEPEVGPESQATPAVVTPPPAPVESTPQVDALAHIYAWNPVVLNRAEACSKCAAPLAKGTEGFVGLSDDPAKPRAWMCADCADEL